MRFLIMALLILFLLVGCNRSPQNGASPSPNENQNIRVQQTAPDQKDNLSPQQVADRLRQLATSVPKVNAANVVVLGNSAIVGLDVDGKLERARVDVIKYSVAEALRKDPYGVNAFVTADLDLNERISRVAEEVNRGRPLAGFLTELGDIVGRIVPQVPKNLTPQDNPPPRSEDSQQLNGKSL